MDLTFRHSSAFTNVNGDGEATITVSPAIGGVTTFLVVPEYHPAAGGRAESWTLTIPDIHVPDNIYTFTMSRTGTGTQTFTRVVADCVETPICFSLPPTLYVTDDNGTHALTYLTNGTYGPIWRGCYTVAATVWSGAPATCTTATGTMAIKYQFNCEEEIVSGTSQRRHRLTLGWTETSVQCGPGGPTQWFFRTGFCTGTDIGTNPAFVAAVAAVPPTVIDPTGPLASEFTFPATHREGAAAVPAVGTCLVTE
jgi:hypothetical protein